MGNTSYKDYYRALGVKRAASDEEIKRAYHSLARTYHPDLHPGDEQAEARLKEINQAYGVLSDPEKREEYDAASTAWKYVARQSGPASAARRTGPPKSAPGSGIPVSLFRSRRPGSSPGSAADFEIKISGLGIIGGLISGLDRLLSAAERAASGQRSPSSKSDTDTKR